jgi:sigma-B regulation protein RsbU (phosphoserine phosphatase)
VTHGRDLLEDAAEDLFEDAPCGHVSTRLDGTIVRVNRTFEAWTGLARAELVDARRFQDLLSPGGRIYYETHYAPLMHMQDSVRAIAVEIVRADGSRMPALINSALRRDDSGRPREVWTSVFDATDRRGYEDELLRARKREHEIGQHLQRSMLSGALPSPDGGELDVLYRPAESGMEVGGDWFDAFWIDDGRTIALVVGDVVGHGIDAAATMGQLRSAVRALASTGLRPGALLERLDGYASRHDVGKMCTLVYAELSLATGRLLFASAGHPPPLLAVPGQQPGFAWGGRSTPLDSYVSEVTRAEATESLPPGGMVLLYTDGLVEQRSRPFDDGMERLRSAVGAYGSDAVSTLLGRLARELPDTEHGDDVCALAARLAPGKTGA